MSDTVSLFEMRRLESLSNTIFGVAMTLLAYDLPKISVSTRTPGWIDLYSTYAPRGSALMLSFAIAGVFWFSHHRRLAVAPQASRSAVLLNLLFLLLIILLPTVNGLYGDYRTSGVVTVAYGGHLILLSAVNGMLWNLALGGRRGPELYRALFPLVPFVVGTAVGFLSPVSAPWIWFIGFAAPFLGSARS